MRTMVDFDAAVPFALPMTDGAVRVGALLEGPQGWGEFSPPEDAPDDRLARWLTMATEPGTVGWPDPVRGRVAVSVPVPLVIAEHARRLVADSGCAAADVVVDGGAAASADDDARLAAVRDALGPDGAIRVRPVRPWDVETAVAAVPRLAAAAGGLQFVLRPCMTLAESAALRQRVDVAVAMPAWLASADDPGLRGAADVAVLAVGALGGVRRALRHAERHDLPCVVVSTVESSIGLAAGLALAGALPDVPFACDLGTRLLLTDDVVADARSLRPADGWLPVAPMPSAPDADALRRTAASDAQAAQVLRRLRIARDAS